jgi:hypothetical protein
VAPAAAPPLYDELETVSLTLGSLVWDEDIAGQVRALFDLMPRQYTGDRHVTARMSDQPHIALVLFPITEDALLFRNNWNGDPPVEFESVKALLAADPTSEDEHPEGEIEEEV